MALTVIIMLITLQTSQLDVLDLGMHLTVHLMDVLDMPHIAVTHIAVEAGMPQP